MNTGQLIKELRLKKGMTQEDLADKTDISTRTIQRIEKGEVDPRSYTLQAIAEALDVDFNLLNNHTDTETSHTLNKTRKIWLPLLHLSGLFLFLIPPILIFIWKKDSIPDIKKHGIDVINFQLSMLLIMIPSGIFAFLIVTVPIIIITAIFSSVIILINTIKVANNQPYNYVWSIKFLKHEEN